MLGKVPSRTRSRSRRGGDRDGVLAEAPRDATPARVGAHPTALEAPPCPASAPAAATQPSASASFQATQEPPPGATYGAGRAATTRSMASVVVVDVEWAATCARTSDRAAASEA